MVVSDCVILILSLIFPIWSHERYCICNKYLLLLSIDRLLSCTSILQNKRFEKSSGRTWSWGPRRLKTLFRRSYGGEPETRRVCRNNRVSCCSLRSARRDGRFPYYRLIELPTSCTNYTDAVLYTRPNSDRRKFQRAAAHLFFRRWRTNIFFVSPDMHMRPGAQTSAREALFRISIVRCIEQIASCRLT